MGKKHRIPLKLCDQIAQRGCKNTEERVKGKTFFSHKAYLAMILHIRPPQRLSVFQEWQHCQKTQKQAVRYRCRSHGNKPAEGVPAPTLICTNSVRAYSPACHTNWEGRGSPAQPPPHPPPQPLSPRTRASYTEPCYQCKRLTGPACEKCHRGKRDQGSWDVGPAVLIRTLPLPNKDHTSPAAGAALRRPAELKFKASQS